MSKEKHQELLDQIYGSGYTNEHLESVKRKRDKKKWEDEAIADFLADRVYEKIFR